MSTVPIFAPDGSLGDIPASQLAAAVKAGAKPGVHITAPDGSPGVIPADRTPDAVKAGAKIVPIEDQPVQHPGFWNNLGDDLWGAVKGTGQLLTQFSSDPATMARNVHANAQRSAAMLANAQQEGQEGHGLAYQGASVAAQAAGVNVPGMEESARTGDFGGVLGHAAAPVATLAAGEALAHGGPAVVDALSDIPAVNKTVNAVKNVTPKQAAQVVGGAAGAGLGHGELSIPGAYYGAKGGGRLAASILGQERANAPIFKSETPAVYPGAPNPQPSPEIAGNNAASKLPEAFQPLPPKAPPVPGTADSPFRPISQLSPTAVSQAITELGPKAPIDTLTTRANQLEQLLNAGLKGKGLEPNVPIGQQGDVITPQTFAERYPNADMESGMSPSAERAWQESAGFKSEPVEDIGAKVRSKMPALPRGAAAESSPGATPVKSTTRTAQGLDTSATSSPTSELSEPQPRNAPAPRESTAVDSYKYDADAKELHVTPKGGNRTYVYGEISPEQAQMFHEAESKGLAWKSIRDNNPYVAKIIDGKRVAVRPVLAPEDQIPNDEWQAGHDLGTQVEGSPRQ